MVQIGDSALAPVFNVLQRPNEWDRQIEADTGLTEIGKFRRDFWAHLANRRPEAPNLRPGHAGSYVRHWVEETDLYVIQYLSSNSVGVYLVGNVNESAGTVQPKVERYRSALKDALGCDLWDQNNRWWCGTRIDINSSDRGNWDRMADWLDEQRQGYERVLRSSPALTE